MGHPEAGAPQCLRWQLRDVVKGFSDFVGYIGRPHTEFRSLKYSRDQKSVNSGTQYEEFSCVYTVGIVIAQENCG